MGANTEWKLCKKYVLIKYRCFFVEIIFNISSSINKLTTNYYTYTITAKISN